MQTLKDLLPQAHAPIAAPPSPSSRCSQPLKPLPTYSSAEMSLLQTCSDGDAFLAAFAPDMVRKYGRPAQLEQAVARESVTLHGLNRIYHPSLAEAWLVTQLTGLCATQGMTEQPSHYQLEDIAAMILDNYGYLKLPEMLQALYHLRRLRFYSRLDSATVLQGIAEWNNQHRIPEIERLEQLRREEEWAEHKRRAVPRPG